MAAALQRGGAIVTQFPPNLVSRPAKESVRLILLGFLDDAMLARHSLAVGDDPEALHDYRVAIRRMRSALRCFRRWLKGAKPRRLGRELGELQRSTNAGRDAEVQLVWLAAQEAGLSASERRGYRWLRAHLEAQKTAAYHQTAGEEEQAFALTAKRIRQRLASYTERVDVLARTATELLGTVVARLARRQAEQLAELLAEVHSPTQEVEAHQARIAAKRLRYLLEPLASATPAVPLLLRRLKGLQELLGQLHDNQVLAETLATAMERAAAEDARHLHDLAVADSGTLKRMRRLSRQTKRQGLLNLARRAAAERKEIFARLAESWLGSAPQTLRSEVETVALSLVHAAGERTEIERKYLLKELPEAAAAAPSLLVEQGWLPGERLQERLRRVQSEAGERFFRTIKLGRGLSRTELEEETTAEVFARLWPLTSGKRVSKRRYRVAEGELTWEVDAFLDRELFLAEVELPRADFPVEPPGWLAAAVVREVTDEADYVNVNLAR